MSNYEFELIRAGGIRYFNTSGQRSAAARMISLRKVNSRVKKKIYWILV